MLNLNPGEKIYLSKRRHIVTLKLQLLPFVLLLLLLLAAISILLFKEISWPNFLIQAFPQFSELQLKFLLIFLLSLFLPILWGVIFFIITYYYLTYWVITNQRTIYAKLVSPFNVKYSSVSHDKIQDITVTVNGILPSIFHFGNLQIQTAGEVGQFAFDRVPEPDIIKQVIFEAQKDYLKELKSL